MRHTLTLATFMIGLAAAAQANDFKPAMQTYLDGQIRSWATSHSIVTAIKTQNASTGSYDQSMIDDLDARWRAEVGTPQTPTITPVLNGATADFLRQQVQSAGGRITEVFIMDAKGLNVAASAVTSDYWQGDEAKFSQTYGQGADAVHFGEIEFDESTATYQGQISMTITDPATGEAIGAMTVGVDAETLM